MNNLSLLLYLAGVSGNIQGVLWTTAVIAGFSAIFVTIIFMITTDGYQSDEHVVFQRMLKYSWPICLGAALLASLIPSERTFYLIAASEMGDRALQTDTGKKAIAAVDRYLDTIGKPDTTK